MKRKKILVWEPLQHSACAFYRANGVLAYMENKNLEFDFHKMHAQLFQHDLYGYDGIFVGRSYDPTGEQIVDWAHQLGLAVITDYDDDLFNVEPDNAAYEAFANPKAQQHVANILRKSHLVIVTTEGLKAQYKRWNGNIKVVPNAFNDHIFDVKKIERARNRIVLWRGGNSHRLEIAEFGQAIVDVMKANPTWKFIMMGFRDIHIERKLHGQAQYIGALPLIEYFHYVRNKLSPAVAVVPLRDSVFNKSKSNIAWQEATWAGATTVLPNQYQWNTVPARIYTDTASFAEQMQYAIQASEKREDENFAKSVLELRENWLLSEVNKQRANAILEVFK